MKHLIISPHTDDAIFSLGGYMQTLRDVTILSLFSGVPTDPVGRKKHKTLLMEHDNACKVYGAKQINSDFFDDVYPRPDEEDLVVWLSDQFGREKYDKVYIPLGIMHPDHIWTREIMMQYFHYDYLYQELPYGTLYPEYAEDIIDTNNLHAEMVMHMTTPQKKKAVECYKSQIQSDHILGEIYKPERLFHA